MSKQNPFNDNNYKHYYGSQFCFDNHPSNPCRKEKCLCSCCPKCLMGPIGETGPTGASQIIGMALVATTAINSVLTVRNPAGNAAALTITPVAGGPRPVSAHLVIAQIQ